MRTSEWIQAGFAVLLVLASWIRPLPAPRRSAVIQLAAFAILVVLLAKLSTYLLGATEASILRDWIPVVLTLVPYWQTGQFFQGPNRKIQNRLLAIDRSLLYFLPHWKFGRYTHLTMEWAYSLCYPLVPLGLAMLYLAGQRQSAGLFWFMVLVPTYFCYAVTPLVPALPPRCLQAENFSVKPNKSRVFNLWLLKHGSIQAISFPSAHVASAVAVSLVLLRTVPVAGAVFLVISFWIAVAAVVGGYHYAIDVLLGAAVSVILFAAWIAHLIPNTLLTTPAIAFAGPL